MFYSKQTKPTFYFNDLVLAKYSFIYMYILFNETCTNTQFKTWQTQPYWQSKIEQGHCYVMLCWYSVSISISFT